MLFLKIELATGKFPYDAWKNPFEQLKQVVKEDPPKLPAGIYSDDFDSFITNWYSHYHTFCTEECSFFSNNHHCVFMHVQ